MNSNNSKPFWWPDMQGFAVVAIIFIAGAALFIRMFHSSNVDDKMLDTMITILFSTCLVGVYSYLFGSSRGSASKDDMLNKIAGTATTPPVTPSIPPNGDSTVTKVIAFIAILALGTVLMGGDSFAQARSKLQITGDVAADAKANFGMTGNPSADATALWQKIVGSSLNDLNYAAAMATQANTLQSKQRLQCVQAIISLNEQASGANLKNPDGTPMTKPDPHAFTDFETLAEVVDNLAPTGPLFVSCAGAAQLAKTSVLSFVNALVTGAAGLAAMPVIPGL